MATINAAITRRLFLSTSEINLQRIVMRKAVEMTQQEWDKMSDKERHAYLSQGKMKVEQQMGIDPNAKPGSGHPVMTRYCVVVRGVQISNWHDNEAAAKAEAKDHLDSMAA